MKLVTAEQMRGLEQRAEAAGVSTVQLMENAGLATAQEGWMLLGTLEDKSILILVGPGNNGGDGLVAARHLFDWGADVRVYLSQARKPDANLRQIEDRGLPLVTADSDPDLLQLDQQLNQANLIVDAILGTGQARPIEGAIAAILDRVASVREKPLPPKLLAVDLPTGLNAGTGAVDPHTPAPDETVTFGVPKVGLYSLPGSASCGRVQTVDIGIPPDAVEELPLDLLTSAWTRDRLPKRPLDSNKGTFGRLLAVVGSINFGGAAYLAADSAYRAGAGLVTVALPKSIQGMVLPLVPEATFLPLAEDDGGFVSDGLASLRQALEQYQALLVGCGVGQRRYTQQFIRSLLYGLADDDQLGVVVDADGLNSLAAHEDWPNRFRAHAILTPHPGEFARLARLSVHEVQADRVGNALRYAQAWQKIVVLKGAHTVIAAPDGRAMLSPFANAALA
ncbi:MAG TPA: NAD(P)H-hydrate dehydratase, partial [Dehalococcoidia bacterium]|nr:NAD(P)H-hydrate dehydratase [Dehalococcoidia bacterium]